LEQISAKERASVSQKTDTIAKLSAHLATEGLMGESQDPYPQTMTTGPPALKEVAMGVTRAKAVILSGHSDIPTKDTLEDTYGLP